MNNWPVKWRRWVGFGVIIAVALLYLLTLDTGLRPDELTGGDLITHQYAQVEARPSNAPGYPLYTMGGWLWFHGPGQLLRGLFNPVEILSLYSTLWSLASLVILYLILLRVTSSPTLSSSQTPTLPGSQTPVWEPEKAAIDALIPALLTAFYAVTYFFWYYSVTTEQYTSAVFQTLLIIWLAFLWDESPRDSLLLLLAFVSGTMLANMVTTLFILPPLLWFILSRRELAVSYLRRPKLIIAALGLALLPLLSYGFIYLRGAQHPEWRGAGSWPTTWAWFVEFLTIRQGRNELAPGLALQNSFTTEFPWLIGQELTWPIFWGGLLGLACLGRRRAIFLYSTLLLYFFFCWLYRFGNWFQVIIPAYPILIIGVGAGLTWLVPKLPFGNRKGPHLSPRILSELIIILFLGGLLLYRLTLSLPRANQHQLPTDTGLDPGWAILADQPPLPARLLAAFEERLALEYLQTVWQLGPGLQVVAAETASSPLPRPETIPLYITRRAAAAAPGLVQDEAISLQAAGEQLIIIPSQPSRLPPTAQPLALDFGGELQLLGWELLPAPVAAQGLPSNWQIALYWQGDDRLETDYTISVRPLVAGQFIMAGDQPAVQDHQPVWGFYPTSRWQAGEVIRDVYAFNLPSPAAPEAVQVVVYQTTQEGFENLGEHVINLNNMQP